MSYLISLFLLHLASFAHLPASSNIHSPAPKYWIEFRDKGISRKHFTPGNPIFEAARASLTERCLNRRSPALGRPEIQCISLEDAPICKRYLDSLSMLGIHVEGKSKWCNAISARLSSSQIRRVRKFGFVSGIYPVGTAKLLSAQPVNSNSYPSSFILHPSSFNPNPSSFNPNPSSFVPHASTLYFVDSTNFADSGCGYNPVIYHYGGSQSQLDRINVWPLHAMGFDGSGVLLGFLDDGMRWKSTSCIEHCNVLSEYDYILHDSTVGLQAGDSAGQDAHGTTTLGCAMGYLPDTLIGPAFNAEVMLAETEVAITERNIEEDNYATALEDMEARGVEITSSSLGYFAFDSGQHSYTYADMNGHTAICTQAVERAAKLGVLVVTAMGNGNGTPYTQVITPADADSILACGALNQDGSIANFSSLGPTSDGRIKPDICAPGVGIWVQDTGGTFSTGNGTSYATPLTSSACCLIKQAHSEATAQEIRHAVMVTGNNAANPDTVYGWGELNAYAAALELGTIVHPIEVWIDSSIHICAGVASKNGISNVILGYAGDTLGTPHLASFKLAADSLIYSCTLDSIQSLSARFGTRMFYKIVAIDDSNQYTVNPLNGWNMLTLPPPLSVPLESSAATRVEVNPNPCSSYFDLTLGEPGGWQLVDALGNIVVKGSSSVATEEAVSTSQFPNGAYFVKFTSSSGETQVVPLIIAH